MKYKIMNIVTGGLKKDGITISQIEYMKKIDCSKIQIDFIGNLNSDKDVVNEIQSLGSTVFVLPNKQTDTFKYICQLYAFLKQNKYDAVHVHGSSTMLVLELVVAKLAGIKVRIAHSRNTVCDHLQMHKCLKPFFQKSYTHAFACGEDAGKWLFGKKPFTIIHNGKDFSRFQFSNDLRQATRKCFRLEDQIVIGHVGKLNKQKNHEYLLNVFEHFHQHHPNSVLYLMGNGIMKDQLQKLAKDKNLEDHVIFAGAVNDVEVRLQAMDIMVFPSLYEGLPNVVLEWQAVGLPCLISDTVTKECAPTDLVEYLSIELPPEQWSEKIEEMLKIERIRTADAQKAVLKLKNDHFDIEINAKQLQERYIEMIQQSNARR